MRRIILTLLATATLALLPGCYSLNAPELAGQGAAVLIKTAAPGAIPYIQTAANAVRSVNGFVTSAPSTAAVHDTVELWVARLPVSATERARMVSYVTQKYDAARPTILRAENVAAGVEAFVAGLEKGGV